MAVNSAAFQAIKTHEEALEFMKGMMNHIGEPLYSRTLVETAVPLQDIPLFVGQTEPALGNITKTRELPLGHLMVIEEIRFALPVNLIADQFIPFLTNGVFKFAPNADARARYFPLEILGTGGGAHVPQVAIAADWVNLGAPHQLAAFRLPVPEVIKGGVPFVAQLRYAIPLQFENDTKVTCIFIGPRAYDASLAVS